MFTHVGWYRRLTVLIPKYTLIGFNLDLWRYIHIYLFLFIIGIIITNQGTLSYM